MCGFRGYSPVYLEVLESSVSNTTPADTFLATFSTN